MNSIPKDQIPRCPIVVESFSPRYANEVGQLISNIQRVEFEIPITLTEQPDLTDIPSFYQKGDGNFWVALENDKVVGTVALLDIGNKQLALRKMFVHESFRGSQFGTAKILLETSLKWAKSRGITEIFLGTTSKFLAAHRFYEKYGFVEISQEQLPKSFPIMSIDTKFYSIEI